MRWGLKQKKLRPTARGAGMKAGTIAAEAINAAKIDLSRLFTLSGT
jgi:hypothetical protein